MSQPDFGTEIQSDSGLVYLLADGDRIGDRLELFLLEGNIDGAVALSGRLHRALARLVSSLKEELNGQILFTGGDDVLAAVPATLASSEGCEALQSVYQEACGCTLSVGVGRTPQSAVDALRRAKLLGRNRTVISRE